MSSRLNRGEVWRVDLGCVAKVRPYLVISIAILEGKRSLVNLVPHRTKARGTKFEVDI